MRGRFSSPGAKRTPATDVLSHSGHPPASAQRPQRKQRTTRHSHIHSELGTTTAKRFDNIPFTTPFTPFTTSSSPSPPPPSSSDVELLACLRMSPDIAFAPFSPSAAFTISNLMSASALATPKPVRASRSMPSSASTSLPVQHDLTTPRARARAARLRANVDAERREDLAALITTPAQWAALRRSFASVKTEFADLDGMSWNAPVLAPAGAPPVLAQPGRPLPRALSPSACGSASAPLLARDDRTVRASDGKKRRLSVSAPGWGRQAVGSTMACPDRWSV